MTGAPHISVMLPEILAALEPAPGKVIVDGTFGAGGYSRALLAAGASVLAFDRDPAAAKYAEDLVGRSDFRLARQSFSTMAEVVGAPVDGVAFDLGVSSMQLDEAPRGFSFNRDGPLDMRMGDSGLTAADLVNETPVAQLAGWFRDYGEERQARRIAQVLDRRRRERPFLRTLDLADTVEAALGGRRGAKIHPATRVFQALRIVVNEELTELENGLLAAERILKPGGVLAVVSFHSLEDRIVKTFLARRSGGGGAASRHAPPKALGQPPSFTLIFKGACAASAAEAAVNPRSRSAKLRAARRTDAPIWRDAA